MTLVKLPSETDYWSHDLLGQMSVAKIMSRGRFKIIKKCMSVNNPSPEEYYRYSYSMGPEEQNSERAGYCTIESRDVLPT